MANSRTEHQLVRWIGISDGNMQEGSFRVDANRLRARERQRHARHPHREIQDHTISGKIAKQVFDAIWAGEGDADAVIAARGLRQISDTGAIAALIDAILATNPKQVEQYRAGQDKVFGCFVGQVMQQSQGKANPQQVNDLLKAKLMGE